MTAERDPGDTMSPVERPSIPDLSDLHPETTEEERRWKAEHRDGPEVGHSSDGASDERSDLRFGDTKAEEDPPEEPPD